MSKIIHESVSLACDARRTFQMFTVNELLKSWLASTADVEPKVGGKYELFWNPDDRETDSTIGCTITAIEPGAFVSFNWKGPKRFSHFMNVADPLTHVTALFTAVCGSVPSTRVHLIHSGWRDTADWEEARLWFEKSWRSALQDLSSAVRQQVP
jgi:uncharacterized protein YndB with AHSA1/START domain